MYNIKNVTYDKEILLHENSIKYIYENYMNSESINHIYLQQIII